jgi:hypothetical protein
MNARRSSEGRGELRGRRHEDDEEGFDLDEDFEEDEEFDDEYDDEEDAEDEEASEEDDYDDFGDYDEEFEDGDDPGPRRGGGGRPRREWTGGE